ncbi:MAG: GDP-mannose 4,6-dehydratase [Nitrososphaerota archaeon]
MRVLITGGVGFIGSHAASYYAEKGNEIIIIDNFSRAKIFGLSNKASLYNLNYLRNKFSNINFIEGDIRDFDLTKKNIKDVDIVIHTAAQVAVTTSIKDPKIDFEINALGTFNILEAARLSNSNPSIIFCSTNKVYGSNVNKIPIKEYKTRYFFADEKFSNGIPESFPIDLCEHTPYGCSKLVGDLYAQDYAHVYGLKIGVFRMSCIYGERQFGIEDQGWIAWFTIATLTNKPITIYGDGKQVRDVLYISDLIEAYDAFINSNLKHEVFNIGGGPENTLSLMELINLLKELTGKEIRIFFDDWRIGDQKVYISNISKAFEKLGWKPKINPRKGIKKIVKWVQENISLFP